MWKPLLLRVSGPALGKAALSISLTAEAALSPTRLDQPPNTPIFLWPCEATCLRAKFRKQDAPWLAMDAYGEDSEASIPLQGVPEPSLGGRQ